jgi:lipid A 3-O-deacylase
MKRRLSPVVLAASLALPYAILAPADAQSSGPAAAQSSGPTADPAAIWSLQDENASASLASLTDRYYVNGLHLGYAAPTGEAPDFAKQLGQTLWGDGQLRVSFDLTQQIYTPADASATNPPANDRPYAGILLANFGLTQDTATTRSSLVLGLGVVGPAALGEEVQNGFHDLIGQPHNNGWGTQLHNEPALEVTSSRVWRLDTGQLGGYETDALPALAAGIGTVRNYALGGVTLRLGEGLHSDYGAPRLTPGLTGGDAFHPTRPFAWYVFAGFDGQAVAQDVTINGNVFQSSRSVKIDPFVGEGQFGVALIAYGARLTYTQVFQTAEFKHQKGGLHEFGSLALSMRF